MIIELPYNPTKLRNILIKSYFIDNQKFILDNLASIQIPSVEESFAKTAFAKTL